MKKLLLLLFSLTSLAATPTDSAQNPCSICWDSLSPQSLSVHTLPCHPSHTFHKACIEEWFSQAPHCPLCRTTQKNPFRPSGCLVTMVALFCRVKEEAKRCFFIIHEICNECEGQLEAHNESFVS